MKTILITGASSGIGKATALRFQSEGWNVIATMRDPSAGGGSGRAGQCAGHPAGRDRRGLHRGGRGRRASPVSAGSTCC